MTAVKTRGNEGSRKNFHSGLIKGVECSQYYRRDNAEKTYSPQMWEANEFVVVSPISALRGRLNVILDSRRKEMIIRLKAFFLLLNWIHFGYAELKECMRLRSINLRIRN